MDQRLFPTTREVNKDASEKFLEYLNEIYGQELVGECEWIVKELTDNGFIRNKEREVKPLGYLNIDTVISNHKLNQESAEKKKNLKPVKKSEWMPESVIFHTDEFHDWIMSINKDFRTRKYYQPFELYKQQAAYWLSLREQYSNYKTKDQQDEFIRREIFGRFRENTTYFENKYLTWKDKDSPTGMSPFEATEANMILLYLLDCGYCSIIAKARQVFFTTSVMGYIANKGMYNYSYYAKVISEDEETILETIDDKFKDPVYAMPDSVRISPYRNSAQRISWHGGWDEKGKTSRVQVGNTKETSVNAGSPDVFIDEGAFIKTFQSIIRQLEPTLKGYDPNTKKQILKRQVVAWTTGGNPNQKSKNAAIGAAFESEFLSAFKNFERKEYGQFWVPLFFNVFARAGYTQDDYDQAYRIAYSIEGEGQEEARRIFHQSNPITVDDVFMRSADTLIPLNEINDHIYRINQKQEPIYGRFEPVYDYSKAFNEFNTNTPYHIVDAIFVPTKGAEDRSTTAAMIDPPNREFKARYYQGTDPIRGASGHSKMSSVIWDAYEKKDSEGKILASKRPVCLLNIPRGSNHQDAFLQTLLMGIYYSKNIMNLVESNDAQPYFDYVAGRNYDYTLIENIVLPEALQTYGHLVGINKRAHVAEKILDQTEAMQKRYGDSIDFIDYYIQLKTYIKVESPTTGRVSYKPKNKRFDFDDVIDAMTYGYILMNAFGDVLPVNIEEKKKMKAAKRLGKYGGFIIGDPSKIFSNR